jgi:two-component system, cell cycle response regulator CpdR
MAPRIMVVDDDHGTRLVLARLLTNEGHVVDAYENAETALAQLHEAHYDVLITDMVMEGMNGLDLVSAARALDGALRCVVASGHAPAADVPADVTWLSKPIDVEELLASVRTMAA